MSAISLGLVTLFSVPAIATAMVDDEPDLEAIYPIKQEAFQGSQIEETLFYLTDVHGPRLTGSPSYMAAAK